MEANLGRYRVCIQLIETMGGSVNYVRYAGYDRVYCAALDAVFVRTARAFTWNGFGSSLL